MKGLKTVISIALIVTGVLSIIFGIIVLSKSVGSYGKYAKFGADFYTYINDNADNIADNTRNNNEITKTGFGFVLIIGGLTISLVSLQSILKELSEKNKVEPQNENKPVESVKQEIEEVFCPRCGHMYLGTYPCSYCYGMSDETLEKSKTMEPKKVLLTSKGFVNCPSCGKYQDGTRRACSGCGQPFIIDEENKD